MFGLFGRGKAPDVKNKSLISFRYSCAGGMTGGHSTTEISVIDGEVILTYSNTEWWHEDDSVTKYRLDKAVLTEIESVFRKYKMHKWNNRKFSNIFVADGPSHCYSFTFRGGASELTDSTNVSFSSQIYPAAYRRKLSEIDMVIAEYKEKGSLVPALVTAEKPDEEPHGKNPPTT